MANVSWELVNGVNLSDDTEGGIYAKVNSQGNTEIACATGFGVCVVELSGDLPLVPAESDDVSSFLDKVSADMNGCQMYVACKSGNNGLTAIGVDDMSEVRFSGKDINTKVESSREYSADEFGEMEDDYPGLADVIGLAEEG